ncbi:MAG: DUF3034 family protein [Pseudomonadota bacterium]|nr:DUF3034 family protein [Pseudomonadota bacterium]
MVSRQLVAIGVAVLGALSAPLQAQSLAAPDMGKLLATGGVSQLEGAGGGGLTPWALISGYGTRDSYGGNLHGTVVATQDYQLNSFGVALGLADRVELSLARQNFRGTGAALDQVTIGQDIVGVKVRVVGDAVTDQDSMLPQIALGAMIKRNTGVGGLAGVNSVKQLGAASENGVDYYIAATKILLSQSLLLNGTLRATKANQLGLLGFGGDLHDRYRPVLELSAAYLATRKLALGLEYRMKPHNLAIDNEKDYYDAFVAYFPTKNISLTAAYAVLGDITILNPTRQKGAYLSLQVGF